jgi:hypothetical protein
MQQCEEILADIYSFLRWQIGGRGLQPRPNVRRGIRCADGIFSEIIATVRCHARPRADGRRDDHARGPGAGGERRRTFDQFVAGVGKARASRI